MQHVHQSLSVIKKQKRISFVVVACYSLFILLFCALCVRYFTNVFNKAFDDTSTLAVKPPPHLDIPRLEKLERILLESPINTSTAATTITTLSTSTITSTPAL